MGISEKVFGTHSSRELKRIEPLIKKVEALRPAMQEMTDEQLKAQTEKLKSALGQGKTLDDILPEAFATVREADRRVLGMEPFRVQVAGAIILHQGRIAEMKTGEGKTLVATMPAYLNALTGRGVHIVTVNDYLAGRDAAQMGQVFGFLGLTTGCVLSDMGQAKRRAQYACDITYITNNEDGFDYLRDNMVTKASDTVQRGLVYAIIDEVDSVLIDEARTPLIISGPSGRPTSLYEKCDILAKGMERGEASARFSKIESLMGEEITETGDYIVDEKDKVVTLTESGIRKAETFFGIRNFSDPENAMIQHCLILALRANSLMRRDRDYVVRDGEVLIVDEFTGRIMDGRRYSDGLHQAIEAKEKVVIREESQTLATVTFQNFFNKYEKKAGMTGTALTEEQEFRDIYGMDVVEVPTNEPVIRIDRPDLVYLTAKEKFEAVCREVEDAFRRRQPVLVGTASIDTSEKLSRMLQSFGIPHQVLNAKNDAKEAEIVAHAGEAGTVTIATNMAGRGTDIKLDEEAKAAGGLLVIGTQRHESRRVDNQLRGRSGRQGDPGESRFYLSLEDDLVRLFVTEKVLETFRRIGTPGEPLSHRMLTSSIENAQKKIEDNNFGIRKNLLDYDAVNNEQRETIYKERRMVLEGQDMRGTVMHMAESVVGRLVSDAFSGRSGDEAMAVLGERVKAVFAIDTAQALPGVVNKAAIEKELKDAVAARYAARERLLPDPEQMRELERRILLAAIDRNWKDHLDDMEQLRQWIGVQSYGQKDPKIEYKKSGYRLFGEMMRRIREETVTTLYNSSIMVVAPPMPRTEGAA